MVKAAFLEWTNVLITLGCFQIKSYLIRKFGLMGDTLSEQHSCPLDYAVCWISKKSCPTHREMRLLFWVHAGANMLPDAAVFYLADTPLEWMPPFPPPRRREEVSLFSVWFNCAENWKCTYIKNSNWKHSIVTCNKTARPQQCGCMRDSSPTRGWNVFVMSPCFIFGGLPQPIK